MLSWTYCRHLIGGGNISIGQSREVVPLIVEVEDSRGVNEEGEGPTHQRGIVSHHQVQDLPMRIREADEELFHGLAGGHR